MATVASGAGPESQTILVVGGGIAGVTAALEAAEAGQDVILVEREASLGGRVTKLNRYFPKLCHPNCGLEINYQRIRRNPRLRVMTMCEVTRNIGRARSLPGDDQAASAIMSTSAARLAETAPKRRRLKVDNPFNYGLDKVKAAYLPHEHAFPMRYVVAPEAIAAGEGEKLKAACAYGALDPDDKGDTFDLHVGAVIWATGLEAVRSKQP